jgi:ubiquinone/menaquinone biosynthesis C-methylase UbiE
MFHPDGPSLTELFIQAMSSTTRGYDLLAPKFDLTPFRTPTELLEPMAEAVGDDGSIEAALDICCGTGAAMRVLRRKCSGHITGIDLSPGMLREARTRVEEAPGTAKVVVLQENALDMPFRDEFDVATCNGAFGHILAPDQDTFAEGVWRALKPGGRFLFVTRPMPSIANPTWWAYRGFNAAMHVRNFVWKPEFIMVYLTFTQERARTVLERNGFSVDFTEPYSGRFRVARLCTATKIG